MPRIVVVCLLVLVGACSFDADYTGGTYTCNDGKCPPGLECRIDLDVPTCRRPRQDAAIDTPPTDAVDAPQAALTCADPGALVAGTATAGTTVGRMRLVNSFCGGGVQNAADAVYRLTTAAPNQQLTVHITGTLSAYVLSTCNASAACLTGNVASNGNPLAVTAAMAGDYFIVVDNLNVALEDAYTLRVDVD